MPRYSGILFWAEALRKVPGDSALKFLQSAFLGIFGVYFTLGEYGMRFFWRKLFFLTALLPPQLHAADTALIQKAVQSATVPMTCGKFFIAMNASASFSPAQHSKLQEYSDLLILQATVTARSQLGDMDKETKQELSESLHKHGESEYRKVMDSIHAIQDSTTRNQEITQVANACMDVVRTIISRK